MTEEQPKGWISIDTSVVEDEPVEETPKPKEAKELAAEAIIEKLFPDDEQWLASVTKKQHIDPQDEDYAEMVEMVKRERRSARSEAVREVMATQVEESELEQYLSIIKTLADKLDATGTDTRVRGLINSTDTLERAELWDAEYDKWQRRFLDNVHDPKEIKARAVDFKNLLADITHSRTSRQYRENRSLGEIQEQWQVLADAYAVTYELPEDYDKDIIRDFRRCAAQVGLDNHNPTMAERYTALFTNNKDVEKEVLTRFLDVAARYGSHHGISEQAVKGFQENILPRLQRKDPEVEALLKPSNSWGMRKGDFGIADYTCHTLVSEVTPANINEMLMALREAPTSDFAKYEQNRKDALSLAGPFGAFRDFVHDQRPLVHETITAMIRYYDGGDPVELRGLLPRTTGYLNSEERTQMILDKNNYEREVEETVNGEKRKAKAIDVLRRLEKNTEPVADIPSTTSDAELNRKLQDMATKKTEQRFVNTRELGDTLAQVNNLLAEAMKNKQIGLEPNMVMALAFLERQAFEVLQKMSYETQVGAFRQPWFQEILRFQELTASIDDFDKQDFDGFIGKLNSLDKLQSNNTDSVAHKLISERLLFQVQRLARKYKEEGKEQWAGALWSGNVAHELLGLVDLKPASTRIGERMRNERLDPTKRLQGD